MIPDYLSLTLAVSALAYSVSTILDIYFILRDEYKNRKDAQK